MSCPRHLVLFGRDLKKWLYTRGVFSLMPQAYASWVSGGCWVLARALHEWIGLGSEIQAIYSWSDSEYFAGKMPQHVVVKVGVCYLDGDGVSSEAGLLHRWATVEGLVEPELAAVNVEELGAAGIECPVGPVRDLAAALYKSFGPGERVAEAARSPE